MGQGLVGFGDETKENNQGLGGCSCAVNSDPWIVKLKKRRR